MLLSRAAPTAQQGSFNLILAPTTRRAFTVPLVNSKMSTAKVRATIAPLAYTGNPPTQRRVLSALKDNIRTLKDDLRANCAALENSLILPAFQVALCASQDSFKTPKARHRVTQRPLPPPPPRRLRLYQNLVLHGVTILTMTYLMQIIFHARPNTHRVTAGTHRSTTVHTRYVVTAERRSSAGHTQVTWDSTNYSAVSCRAFRTNLQRHARLLPRLPRLPQQRQQQPRLPQPQPRRQPRPRAIHLLHIPALVCIATTGSISNHCSVITWKT
mmetsp:Transcript_13568/g.19736  ORF Transcript_13568/g.19736 Transcript_13568/m.19736 type:complete len:271 (-) Transcript_13568:819-1631(-)